MDHFSSPISEKKSTGYSSCMKTSLAKRVYKNKSSPEEIKDMTELVFSVFLFFHLYNKIFEGYAIKCGLKTFHGNVCVRINYTVHEET